MCKSNLDIVVLLVYVLVVLLVYVLIYFLVSPVRIINVPCSLGPISFGVESVLSFHTVRRRQLYVDSRCKEALPCPSEDGAPRTRSAAHSPTGAHRLAKLAPSAASVLRL